MLLGCWAPLGFANGAGEVEPPTMLTKADRNTRVMVNTPTRVLFILDRTIFLEKVCRGAGKSWGSRWGERQHRIQWALHKPSHNQVSRPPSSLASATRGPSGTRATASRPTAAQTLQLASQVWVYLGSSQVREARRKEEGCYLDPDRETGKQRTQRLYLLCEF